MRELKPPSPEELSAYVDGELDDGRRAEISYLLTTERALSREAAIHRALRDGMQSLTAHDALVPPSKALRNAISKLGSLHGRRHRRIAVAAGVAAGAIVAVLLWAAGGRLQQDPRHDLVEDTLYFIDQGRAGVESGRDPGALLARTLPGLSPASLNSARLASEGFVLEGGRLMAVDGTGAVLLIYRDARGGPLGLLVSRTAPETGHVPRSDSAELIRWRQGEHSFTLIGRQRRAVLDRFQAAYLAR